MELEVEYTDQFNTWWEGLTEAEQEDIDAVVRVLEQRGSALRRPHVGMIDGSRHANMKELIVQHAVRPYRILFAFDPRRQEDR
ncbi:MAG TPA: type II toxin-antitoxin system RelE/ParE family toxin [Methylomirabilota bacterium]|nr:type II toxin-antitoxin system RelE/ParE family toxin [Methylomirabilota bacterium]